LKRERGQSFAAAARDELLHVVPRHKPCQKAELCAAVQVCGSLFISQGTLGLRIATENAGLARKMYAQIRELTGERVVIMARENKRLKQPDTVLLELSGRDVVLGFLHELQIFDEGNILRGVPSFAVRTCCKRAYLRGLFLACGSMTNPSRAYHLEWVFHDEEMAQNVQVLLAELNISAQHSVRKNQHVIYLKDGEGIAQTLAQIGAHNALFALEDARVLRSVKNNVNRAVNCETANVNRTVNASMQQVACIEHLAQTGKLAKLSASLRQAADARLVSPQASLIELSQSLSPPCGKSCMNHRLRRLVSLAQESGFVHDELGGGSDG
jgi:hypothetical protein